MNISVITLVNNWPMYEKMLLGPLYPDIELIPVFDSISATKGLNEGIDRASNDIMILCHQDVSLPFSFLDKLENTINGLSENLGIVGTFGRDLNLNCAGDIYNPFPKRITNGKLPSKALTLDEHCIIVKKSSGLRFDENLYYYHLYGADICLAAIERGLENYIIGSQLNHLSPKGTFDDTFKKAVDWFINKWKNRTNIKLFRTMCCEIDFETGNWIQYK